MADPDELRALAAELQAAEQELAEADRLLKRELLKAGLDVAGIPDPSPVSDLLSARLSAEDGDVVAVALSLLSLIPYAGDAVAKSAKAGRLGKSILALQMRVASGVAKVNKVREAYNAAAKRAGDAFVKKVGDAVKKKVDEVIAKTKGAPNAKPDPTVPCKTKKTPHVPKVRPWPTPRAKKLLEELEELNKPPPSKAKSHRKRLLSEELGNEAAKQHLRRKLGKDIADEDFTTFSGPHTVNMVYKDPGTGKVHVLEAKGGSSQLGTRVGRHPPHKGQTLKQGSPEYLEDVARMMKNSPDPAKRAAGREILDAQKRGDLHYTGVRGGYDSKSPTLQPREPQEVFDR